MTTEAPKDVEAARAELAATLDEIEGKLNVPKRARGAAKIAEAKVRALRKSNPALLASVAAGAASAIGAGVWLAIRQLRK